VEQYSVSHREWSVHARGLDQSLTVKTRVSSCERLLVVELYMLSLLEYLRTLKRESQ
jgi:hypothetical protein